MFNWFVFRGGTRGRGRGSVRGRGRGQATNINRSALDSELDSYMAQANMDSELLGA